LLRFGGETERPVVFFWPDYFSGSEYLTRSTCWYSLPRQEFPRFVLCSGRLAGRSQPMVGGDCRVLRFASADSDHAAKNGQSTGSSGTSSSLTNELKEKLHTLLALYDGSYFYRLINVGGLFNKMYDQPAAMYVPVWLVLAFAIVAVASFVRDKHRLRSVGFLLTSLVLTTAGVLLLPGAIEFIMRSWPFLFRS